MSWLNRRQISFIYSPSIQDSNFHSSLQLQALRAEHEHKAPWLLHFSTPQRSLYISTCPFILQFIVASCLIVYLVPCSVMPQPLFYVQQYQHFAKPQWVFKRHKHVMQLPWGYKNWMRLDWMKFKDIWTFQTSLMTLRTAFEITQSVHAPYQGDGPVRQHWIKVKMVNTDALKHSVKIICYKQTKWMNRILLWD